MFVKEAGVSFPPPSLLGPATTADGLTWKANWPEKSYMPQECMRLRVFRTASALSTLSPVMGQMPPLARVAAMTLPDSQVTSTEHSYGNERVKGQCEH